ncbi:MAG: TadE/TadG family type IV pilus assembly protein [Bacilli bacterium]
MKINDKAQALVEFVLILPILIFLIFSVIDIGKIIYVKNHIENKTNDVVDLLNKNKDFDEIVKLVNKDNPYKIELNLTYESDNYLTIKLYGLVDILTPGLNLILDNPYKVIVKRVVPYE